MRIGIKLAIVSLIKNSIILREYGSFSRTAGDPNSAGAWLMRHNHKASFCFQITFDKHFSEKPIAHVDLSFRLNQLATDPSKGISGTGDNLKALSDDLSLIMACRPKLCEQTLGNAPFSHQITKTMFVCELLPVAVRLLPERREGALTRRPSSWRLSPWRLRCRRPCRKPAPEGGHTRRRSGP